MTLFFNNYTSPMFTNINLLTDVILLSTIWYHFFRFSERIIVV